MERGRKIYEGKWKILYETADPALLVQRFKDVPMLAASASQAKVPRRGAMKNQISAALFTLLHGNGIPTHFVRVLGQRDMLVRRLEMIRLEVVVRNIAAGSLAKRLGMEVGTRLPVPVLEFYYKSDELGDPMINDYHIKAINLATEDEVRTLSEMALRVNELLTGYLKDKGLSLIDFKLEFGRHKGKILLGDEISPDTCRFWDTKTNEKLDKDRFRRDLGGVEEAYQEVVRRIEGR